MSARLSCLLVSHIIYSTYIVRLLLFFFFFNDTATTEIYTLSLHDALPISREKSSTRAATSTRRAWCCSSVSRAACRSTPRRRDRKSTRLNSSHLVISYAVFCLKKKKSTSKYATRRTLCHMQAGCGLLLLKV